MSFWKAKRKMWFLEPLPILKQEILNKNINPLAFPLLQLHSNAILKFEEGEKQIRIRWLLVGQEIIWQTRTEN